MKRTKLGICSLVGALVVIGLSSSALAQAPGGRGAGRQRGNGGNFDPAQARERMMTRLKEQLGATDDEWKALQPRVEKVMTAQRGTRSGGQGGPGGPGAARGGGRNRNGNGGQADQQQPQPPREPQSAVATAAQELRTALEDKNANAELIQQKLKTLRDTRAKAHEELATAQKELRELLTQRQEAVLVTNGFLE